VSRFARRGGTEEQQRATTIELFYDLVFVFAITQISHLLLAHLTWTGLFHAAVVLAIVWWSWNYTTWVTNELDPESIAVRLVLIGVALASFAMAIAIPHAFAHRALLFAGSYVALQCGRHAFMTFVAGEPGSDVREQSLHILIWFLAAAPLWILGAVVPGGRAALWLVALAIDYAAPLFVYRVPFRRRLAPESWDVTTSHFAERFQLFIIISLGESVVTTGATASGLSLTSERMIAFALAFLATAALWWLYFDYVARISERRLELADDRTLMARDAFTYLHMVFVAGVIVAAVGNEIVLARPGADLSAAELAAVGGGPALYLLGHVAFRLRLAGSPSWRRLAGALGCCVAAVAGAVLPAFAVLALVVASLSAVIASELLSGTRRAARGEQSPLEALEPG
jgi:low temperature requirement protein LtrA